ncbi:hypothetical protein CARUB_v10012484mg, partial [Capsella rubella]
DKNGDYVVVWQFHQGQFLGYCKRWDLHYRDIPVVDHVQGPQRCGAQRLLSLLPGRPLLSGQDGFKDVSVLPSFPMWKPLRRTANYRPMGIEKLITYGDRIVVTTSGEVLLVFTQAYEVICERPRIFRVYKRNPKEQDTTLVEVESIGDEALFYNLGITVPADHTLGIEPNSIYFTRDDRFGLKHGKSPCLDICVYNIATRTIKVIPSLASLELKDAQWFLPSLNIWLFLRVSLALSFSYGCVILIGK